jgi:hypothetical protein
MVIQPGSPLLSESSLLSHLLMLHSRNSPGAYEALFLADATISYLSRPVSEMHESQTDAMKEFQVVMECGFIQDLNLDDPSSYVRSPHMLELIDIFDQLFFLDKLSLTQMDFHWEDSLEAPDLSGLGQHNKGLLSEQQSWWHVFSMYRTRESGLRSGTLASERLGTLLRMMLWAFGYQFICKLCNTAFEHCTAYGWFFQKAGR